MWLPNSLGNFGSSPSSYNYHNDHQPPADGAKVWMAVEFDVTGKTLGTITCSRNGRAIANLGGKLRW